MYVYIYIHIRDTDHDMLPVHPPAPEVLRDTLSICVGGEEICDAQLVREVDPEEPPGREWDLYGFL